MDVIKCVSVDRYSMRMSMTTFGGGWCSCGDEMLRDWSWGESKGRGEIEMRGGRSGFEEMLERRPMMAKANELAR